MLGGDLGLIERGRFDQVADGFGLGQIDAAEEIGAEGEFAGRRETCAELDGTLNTIAKDDGGAVARDLDDVLAGKAARRFKVSGDDFIDGLAGGILELAKGGVTGLRGVEAGEELGAKRGAIRAG